jgi:hypothetical protein
MYVATTKDDGNAADACLPQAGAFFSSLLQVAVEP